MADHALWTTLIREAASAVLLSAVLAWLARSRLTASPQPGAMSPPRSVFIVGIVVFLFFASLAILSNAFANPTTTWWTTACFAGFALAAAPLIAAYFLERHELSREGIAFRNFVGIRKDLRWSALRSVRYSAGMSWFRLETQAGATARVSTLLTGLPEFARLVLSHAHPNAIDDRTRQLLEASAAGNPPPYPR